MSEKVVETKKEATVKEETTKTVETPKKPTATKKVETAKKPTVAKKSKATSKPAEKVTPVVAKELPSAENEKPEEVEKVTGEVIPFTGKEIERFNNLSSDIQKEVEKVNVSYLFIAKKIYAIYRNELYKIDLKANIYDWAQEKFGFSRGTCNKYIRICDKFGEIDPVKKECIKLRPEYEPYTSSQLKEMCQVPEELLEKFKPEMSVRDMIRLKNNCETKGIPLEKPKSAKTKKLVSVNSQNMDVALNTDYPELTQKIEDFRNEHPDTDFDIAITLVYK